MARVFEVSFLSNLVIKLGFVGGINIDGETVGRGLAPAATKDLTRQSGGSKPPPYKIPYIHLFDEPPFDCFKQTDKPKFERTFPTKKRPA